MTPPLADTTVTVDRVELVEGYGIRWRAEGDGPLLVWAHDALTSIDQDDDAHIIDFGSITSGHRLLRLDAVGHGRSAGVFDPADHEWRARGEILVHLTRQLELERFAVGGFGAGAATALHAAALAPERAQRLILAAPAAIWSVPSWLTHLPRPFGMGLLVGTTEPMRLFGRINPLPLPRRRGALGRFHAAGIRRLIEAPRNQFNAVLIGAARSTLPDADQLAALDVPALVLAYHGDPTHPASMAERMAASLPNARLEIASDTHEVARWGDRIAEFLDG